VVTYFCPFDRQQLISVPESLIAVFQNYVVFHAVPKTRVSQIFCETEFIFTELPLQTVKHVYQISYTPSVINSLFMVTFLFRLVR